MDFPNIPEILDFLVANLGIPDKSIISVGFPHAKPFEYRDPRNFSPRLLFPEKMFPETEKKLFRGKRFSVEMFLGGKVSVVSGFPRFVRISGFLGKFSFQDIFEIMDFRNISEIFDFLVANLGIPDKSMISARFPDAKPFENRIFSPRNFSPRKVSPRSKNGLGGKFSRVPVRTRPPRGSSRGGWLFRT